MPFAVWITGLPGSGKSTIAKELLKKLGDTEYLRLDAIRKKYVSKPVFSEEERELVYGKLVDDGVAEVKKGKNVLFDATANKLAWRKKARDSIRNFLEVYVECPVETCMERESKRPGGLVTADLYRKALERSRTGKNFDGLGQVVGVDVEYEKNRDAEIVINSSKLAPEEAAGIIFKEIKKRGWE